MRGAEPIEELSKTPDESGKLDMQQLATNVIFAEALHRAHSVIAPLNTDGAKVPIFWVHSVTGQGTDPIPVATNLGPHQPFYSIRAPSEQRDTALAASVEAMARFYVTEIDRFQPIGPLIIGGWSAGVVVALEMAQQLLRAGREVRHLMVVDFAPLNSGIRINRMVAFGRRATNWLYTEGRIRRSCRHLGRRIWQQMREKIRQSLRNHPLDDLVASRGYSEAESAFVRTLHDTVDAYVPAPYAGSVLFYCAVEGDGEGAMNNRNMHANHMIRVWQSLAPRLTVSRIDADHISLIKGPAVAALARSMQADLDGSDPQR